MQGMSCTSLLFPQRLKVNVPGRVVMSELILHAAHLSEAHQLRFSYLFEVAAKHWRDKQPSQTAKTATELWVIDAHSAPDAIQNRSNSSFVLLIATDDQAQAARAQWPDQIDAQLPPDYSVGRLTQPARTYQRASAWQTAA